MGTEKQATWSNVQAYSLSAICLVLGIASGYLFHAPRPATLKTPAATQQAPAPQPASMNVTPEQMKHMADEKVRPLLAELQSRPNDVPLLIEIGKTYFYGRQLPLAAEYFERAAKLKPTAEIYTSAASVYHYEGDDKKAIETLNRALQIDPKFDGALFNLGMIKWQSQGDAKGAIGAWEKLLKTHPNHPKRAEVEMFIAQAKKHMNLPPAPNAAKTAQ